MIESLLLVSMTTAGGMPSLQASDRLKVSQVAGSTAYVCDASRSWNTYLNNLSELRGGRIKPFSLARIKDLWSVIERFDKSVFPPYATASQDGAFSMTWDKGRHHFEIEIDPKGTYGWFYLDRESDLRAGEEEIHLGSYSPSMFDFLWRTIGGEKWS